MFRYLFEAGEAQDRVVARARQLRDSLDAEARGTPEDGLVDPDVACDQVVAALTDDALVTTARGAGSWPDVRQRLVEANRDPGRRGQWLHDDPVSYLQLGPPARRGRIIRSDETDDLSFLSKSIRLGEHLESVGEMAERIGGAVGLPPALVEAVGEAGRLHDLGKYDDRFQRLLGGADGFALAKSRQSRTDPDRQRQDAGWPRGGRHEVLSARLVEAWLLGAAERLAGLDRDLVVHLVISHHGHGRPSTPAVRDPGVHLTTGQVDGEEVAVTSSLADPEWPQPRRFRVLCERYGYWGLALLEAVVRQADHRASAWSDPAAGAVEPVDMGVA